MMTEETKLVVDDCTVVVVGHTGEKPFIAFGCTDTPDSVLFSGHDEIEALLDFLERRVPEVMG